MTYLDTAEQTTDMTFSVADINGTQIYSSPVTLSNGSGSAYYDVPTVKGTSYRFGFTAWNTQHENVSAYRGIDFQWASPLVDFGWPSEWYIMIGLACMFIMAGGVYAIGQVLGAETRARASVWATAMITGAVIGLVIYLVLPGLISWLYKGSAGSGERCNFVK
jgi:hypothetical protein